MPANGQGGRWESILERARARTASRSGLLPPNVAAAVEQAFDTRDSLMKEPAASQAEVANLTNAIAMLAGEWADLFAALPIPCILTDPAGKVLHSNQAAALLLNVSTHHLKSRMLTYFAEECARFLAALNELPSADVVFPGAFPSGRVSAPRWTST